MVLFPYPQLSGSLVMPGMQLFEDRELAGRAQLVKSARICCAAPLLGSEQTEPSATTYASLSANCAHVSAHTGRESSDDKEHGWIEFWIIALQITVVVKRA